MANLDKWKYGGRRQTFCPKCSKRTRMPGLCAKCQAAIPDSAIEAAERRACGLYDA